MSDSISSSIGDTDESVVANESCGCEVICLKNCKRIRFTTLQYFATPKFALFFLCCASVAQGFVITGLYSVVVTTLEKRFHLHSTETGFIASSYDISSLATVLFITYLGGRGHKPQWIGWGIFIMGIGSALFSLPHFWAPPYQLGEEQHNLCNSTVTHTKCFPSHLKNYMLVFVIAQFLHGAGGTTLFTLGITYLDENVEQVDSSFYHGIYYASSVVGPALGYILGGRFLTIYVDINASVNIDDTSSLWVGAWWLGFLMGGIVVIALAFPVLFLPRQLPHTTHVRLDREKEMHQGLDATKIRHFGSANRLSELWQSVAVLFKNPTFLLITLAGALDAALVLGVSTFGPKYLQSAFSITPALSALYFGVLAILAGATGQFFGGYIVTKAKLSVPGILKFCAVCAAVAFTTSFVFFRTCPDTPFAGATVNYSYSEQAPAAWPANDHASTCNAECACNPDSFDPVCGGDDVTYYSPCFAGCRNRRSSQVYTDCSCIPWPNGTAGSDAVAGKCPSTSCAGLNLFLVVFFISILATFLAGTPAVQAVLRVVPFTQRSFAIGIKIRPKCRFAAAQYLEPDFIYQKLNARFLCPIEVQPTSTTNVTKNSDHRKKVLVFGNGFILGFAHSEKFVILRTLGSIPGPIIFGRVLDLACVVWSTECGKQGSCELYKNEDLAAHMVALAAIIKAIVTLLFVMAWLVYRPPPKEVLDQLDGLSLDNPVAQNGLGLPSSHGASAALSGLTRLRSTKYVGVSYKTLQEDTADVDL